MIIWTIINLVGGIIGWAFGNVLIGGAFYLPTKLALKLENQIFSASVGLLMSAFYGIFNIGWPIWMIYGWWYGIAHSTQVVS